MRSVTRGVLGAKRNMLGMPAGGPPVQEAEDDWETDVELWVLVCPNVSQKFFDALQYKCHTLA